MADIEIIYREPYCRMRQSDFDYQCFTSEADCGVCEYFHRGEYTPPAFPLGNCVHAKFRYKYKGIVAKRYEIETFEDDYNPHLNCMDVTVCKRTYECVKVVLNGKVIYNEYIELNEESEGEE